MILKPQTVEDIIKNREEWAAALESGDYKQTRRCLRRGDRFCCLGVLCHIVDPNRDNWRFGSKYPPGEYLSLVGIDSVEKNGFMDFDADGIAYDLALMNDNGSTFPDIAQMIRDLPLPTEVPS